MISNDKFHSGQGFHANLHKVATLEQSLKITQYRKTSTLPIVLILEQINIYSGILSELLLKENME